MITIDLKVLAFVCQWANSINPFLGSFLFFNSLLSTFSPYFIHKATEQQSLMGGGPLCKEGSEIMGLFSRALEELREVMSKDELKHFLPFISGKVHRKWYCCLWMSSPHLNYHGTGIVKCRTRTRTRTRTQRC